MIITEKENAARRIADILSGGTYDSSRENGVNIYEWGGKRCVGLSGHVVGVDFPSEYSDWRDVEPVELIDASVEKKATKENIVATLRILSRKATTATIATDYDREGELIGKEAYEIVREVNEDVPIRRVRFSSITENEVQDAFNNPDELDFDLAAAGEARQIIDLVWGAALTRFLSLSAGQLGNDFISVGRVQSPTLKLIVDREREIQAFDPESYWELFADLHKDETSFESQYFYRDEDDNEAERVWDEATAKEVYETLSENDSATVVDVNRRTRTDDPPTPFNTTQFIRAAGSLGYSAQRAMSIAEDLYTAGYITYPRTDNTVYPDDLDPEELLDDFVGHPTLGESAEDLLEADEIEPTEGDEETTDHPPIHPTGEIPARGGDVSDDEWEVYELVVRRFYATVADPAIWEHLKVVSEAADCRLKANGKRLVEAGYHDVYPYFNTSENYVPDVDEGEELALTDVELEDKETQPPRRYGQSRLIETMEDMGIGTKCLTADTTVLHRSDVEIVRSPVQELFESGQVVMADGDTNIATTSETPTTLSLNEQTGLVEDQETTLVSERPLGDDERVLDIVTPAGTFSVTDDHPLYVTTEDGFDVRPAKAIEPGEELLTVRSDPTEYAADDGPVAVSWGTFAANCTVDSKLYGTGANDALAAYRERTGQTQRELAATVGADRSHISEFENDHRDVPVWILGELGIEPDGLHGLNNDVTFENPFPIQWSPALARLLGNLLGDGSVYVDETENVVDIRYHNTDRRLIERFATDIESVFGVRPTITEQPGRKTHHKTRYQANVPAAVGRILHVVLEEVSTDGVPNVPTVYAPWFIGALFDDEGHLSTDRKAFISNTDHDLLGAVQQLLSALDIETKLAAGQHKLHIRGRRTLERFLDTVPISCDWKFHRGLDSLRAYPVTERKAELLATLADRALTTDEIADELEISQPLAQTTVSELKEDEYIETEIEGSNRSHDGNRTFRYTADGFKSSIYATLLGLPSSTTVTDLSERDYDGAVYDLTVSDAAPNFAIEGGIVVHNSTRHNTLEKLYDRGYIESDPPRPTKLAMAVVDAAENYADRVVSEGMTAQLEADMDAIASGEAGLEDVTDESREMLEEIFANLAESRDEIGDHLRKSLKDDKRLGPCPDCGEDLLVRNSRHGSYFIGCDGYPDCENTLPLPSTGKPLILEDECDEHGLNEVKMLAGRQTFVHGCPLCKAEDAGEGPVLGACPDCGDEHDGELAVKTLQSGSRLVGCTRYPDCEYSLPLPRRGDIEVTDERCEEHDLPELLVHSGDEPWELGCPICNYQEFQARESDSGSDLEALEGVGAKTVEKLVAAGIESLSDLSDADPDAVAESVDGVSADRIRNWQAEA
nr:DNA topoisomerase I [Natronolimnobius sp. AArcel1]